MNLKDIFKKKPKKRFWCVTVDLYRNSTHRGSYEVHAETDGEIPNASVIRFNALMNFQTNGIDCNKAVIRYPMQEMTQKEFEDHLKIDPQIKELSEKYKANQKANSRPKKGGSNGTNRKIGAQKRAEIEARKKQNRRN